MKNSIIALLIMSLFASFTLSGSDTSRCFLSGSIYDSADSTSLPFAAVYLYIDSTLVAQTSTDHFGYFEFVDIDKQNYNLEIRYIGFNKEHYKVQFTQNEKIELGHIYLSSSFYGCNFYTELVETKNECTPVRRIMYNYDTRLDNSIQSNDIYRTLRWMNSEFQIE